jgi:phospholipase A1
MKQYFQIWGPMVRAFIFLLLLGLPVSIHAEALDILVAAPKQTPIAGTPMLFFIYYHNAGKFPISMPNDQELGCVLISQGLSVETKARKTEPEGSEPVIIGVQGYAKALYQLQLPDTIHGPVKLEIPQFGDVGLNLTVGEKQLQEENTLSWLPQTTDEPLDALIQLYQPYVKNISFYEPMYFLVGTQPEYSKFQLSLKYRLFNPEKPFVKKRSWVKGFHFGYTQTSFWDLASDSAPFEDTSYKPELFYITDRLKTKITAWNALFLQAGLRHESNGRGGEFSRSTNIAYLQPIFIFYNKHDRTGLKITPKVWTYYGNEDENNPDIQNYRGYFNLGVTFGKADGLVIDTKSWWAAEGASVQIDATYPLHTLFFSDLDLYFQVQYVNRLAESLLHYEDRIEAFRLGFAVVR